jgi:cell division protein FtsL
MMNLNWQDARFRRALLMVLVLLAVALTVHEIFGERGYFALRRRRQELQNLQQQVKQLQEENQKLEQQIKGLQSDPKAVEKLAREQMKLAKPGEIIYVLPGKNPKDEKPPVEKK